MVTCKYCGETGLKWGCTDSGWRLGYVLPNGGFDKHFCDAGSDGDCLDDYMEWANDRPRLGECGQCEWWVQTYDPITKTTRNSCHRYAPTPMRESVLDRVVWPSTIKTDKCGEFQEKDEVDA